MIRPSIFISASCLWSNDQLSLCIFFFCLLFPCFASLRVQYGMTHLKASLWPFLYLNGWAKYSKKKAWILKNLLWFSFMCLYVGVILSSGSSDVFRPVSSSLYLPRNHQRSGLWKLYQGIFTVEFLSWNQSLNKLQIDAYTEILDQNGCFFIKPFLKLFCFLV